jgi:hypothetical protein
MATKKQGKTSSVGLHVRHSVVSFQNKVGVSERHGIFYLPISLEIKSLEFVLARLTLNVLEKIALSLHKNE